MHESIFNWHGYMAVTPGDKSLNIIHRHNYEFIFKIPQIVIR